MQSKRATALVYRTQLTKSPIVENAQRCQHNLYVIEKYFQCTTIPSPQCGSIFIHLAIVASQNVK